MAPEIDMRWCNDHEHEHEHEHELLITKQKRWKVILKPQESFIHCPPKGQTGFIYCPEPEYNPDLEYPEDANLADESIKPNGVLHMATAKEVAEDWHLRSTAEYLEALLPHIYFQFISYSVELPYDPPPKFDADGKEMFQLCALYTVVYDQLVYVYVLNFPWFNIKVPESREIELELNRSEMR
ncbi:hypothetical protein BT63DRAFT_456827 [Microthyrium microscopicum]|uniref:Uncharacterized protein n=1 Tax=Microthyrium microscopicum TaxID=703497 RepID=A0A6A6U8U9_9PEZI|nr:hypothetical protein BT63DRAFT_456827 [Microthyrium microscopicum]